MFEAVAIVVGAGSGKRLGEAVPKAFVPLAGSPLLVRSARSALSVPAVGAVIAVAPAGYEDLAHSMLEPLGSHTVVTGGATRQASVRAALAVVPEDVRYVLVHDAARPLASLELFSSVLAVFDTSSTVVGVVPVLPISDTVKRVRDGEVVSTEPRGELGLAQTPQGFVAEALRDAHARAERDGVEATDDAALLEWAGYRVHVVAGDPGNVKITTREDHALAEQLLAGRRHG